MTTLRTCFRGEGSGDKLQGDRNSQPVTRAEDKPNVSPAARNLALAHYIERLIDEGIIRDYTAAAEMLGVSQPRMTMLMGLVLLAPRIQEAILLAQLAPKEKPLRQLARIQLWEGQHACLIERG